jgi:hypothetical protein
MRKQEKEAGIGMSKWAVIDLQVPCTAVNVG